MSLSVFIIALNEEKKLTRCLDSVQWADEIVIVDGGSHDKTPEIAKRHTDKVYFKPFIDYAGQKNHALSKTSGSWVFSLDADEETPEELKKEIQAVIRDPGAADGYFVRRRSFIFGREFAFTGTQKDKPLRLFKKASDARFEQPIHERVVLSGRTGTLKHSLRHYTYSDLNDYLARLNRYTVFEAGFLKTKRYRLKASDFVLRPLGMFFKLYFIEQGFRDGFQGFVFSVLSGFYVFVKYAKYQESLEAA